MNIDERLEALTQAVELLARMHQDTERTIEQGRKETDAKLATLTERSIQLMEVYTRLGNIVISHEDRISDLEDRQRQ